MDDERTFTRNSYKEQNVYRVENNSYHPHKF